MGIFDIFQKKPVSFEVASKKLMATAGGKNIENIEYFLEKTLPQIATYLDVDLNSYEMGYLRNCTLIVCLWIAAKTVEPEGKQLLDIACRSDDDEVFKKILLIRYEQYKNAWDESAGANQQTLAKHILSDMLFPDAPDERVNNISAMSLMNTFVFNVMGKVLKAKAEMVSG